MSLGLWIMSCVLAARPIPVTGGKGRTKAVTEAVPTCNAEAQSNATTLVPVDANKATDAAAPPREASTISETHHGAGSTGPSVSGFVRPALLWRYRPNAVPRDAWNYGLDDSLLLLIVEQQPTPMFGYKMTLFASTDTISVLTGARLSGNDDSNQRHTLSTSATSVIGNFVDEASIFIQPTPGLRFRVGKMRVPVTLETWSAWAYRLFWERASPTAYFIPMTDFGVMAELAPFGDSVVMRGGVFNGSGISAGESDERGLMYALRVDVAPLGSAEVVDNEHGNLRVSVGGGVVYYDAKVFDDAGYVSSHAEELQLDVSLRLNYAGFSMQGEYIVHRRSDSVSSVQKMDAGWYAQSAYYVPLPSQWGIGPMLRYGTVTADRAYMPRMTRWLEAGVAIFSGRGGLFNATQITVTYVSEVRATEGDSARMLVSRLMVQF